MLAMPKADTNAGTNAALDAQVNHALNLPKLTVPKLN
jgi:hypothetical protein